MAGGEMEQIQFLLGHVSVQTTEKYLGSKQRLRGAVNDQIGIEPWWPKAIRARSTRTGRRLYVQVIVRISGASNLPSEKGVFRSRSGEALVQTEFPRATQIEALPSPDRQRGLDIAKCRGVVVVMELIRPAGWE
jgi:hypothetical protein